MMYSHENFSRGKLLPKFYYLSDIYTTLGPVTLSPILLSDGLDHLYTIQNENPEL